MLLSYEVTITGVIILIANNCPVNGLVDAQYSVDARVINFSLLRLHLLLNQSAKISPVSVHRETLKSALILFQTRLNVSPRWYALTSCIVEVLRKYTREYTCSIWRMFSFFVVCFTACFMSYPCHLHLITLRYPPHRTNSSLYSVSCQPSRSCGRLYPFLVHSV